MKTALNGALRYVDGAWQWRSGDYEPRVQSMRRRHLAPNFRVSGGMVEVPPDWKAARHWPSGQRDQDTAAIIASMLAGQRPSDIYAEGAAERRDDHRATRQGWTIPIGQWDAAMDDVVGCLWDKADEQQIMERARREA